MTIDAAAVDAFVAQRMAATLAPGVSLAITHGNDVLYLRGYGTAAGGQPVTPETPFLIGSVSKGMTAVAVLQLVDAGRLDLDAPVIRYLPEFRVADAAVAQRITVRHLLHHTSGMADRGFPHMTLPQPVTIEERVASLATADLVTEPGTRFDYFDPNYAVLARLVEVITGEPFDAYLDRAVFTPLAMSSTTGVVQTSDLPAAVPGLAQGHIAPFGLPVATDEMNGYLAGSSGIASTAHDMAQYLLFHAGAHPAGDKVLSRSSLAELHRAPTGVRSSYAMGWVRTERPGAVPVLHHNGVLGTFHADAVVVPDESLGVTLLYNANHALAAYDATWQGILELLRGRPAPVPVVDARAIELGFGLLTALGIVIRVRGLRRLGQRPVDGRGNAVRRLLRITWALVPLAVLVALSPLVALTSGRVFSLAQLGGAMPGPTIYLAANAAMGLIQAGLLLHRARPAARHVPDAGGPARSAGPPIRARRTDR